ncbi:transposable element Tcb2 transposase [Trichonephila clavipes]|nr:transposable element Tcb2 transposase [Trichonephila clavipes]
MLLGGLNVSRSMVWSTVSGINIKPKHLCPEDMFQIHTLESDSGRLLIWRERSTTYHQSNTVERHSYRGGGIMIWAGISLGGHTDLHVFQGGTLTGVRYQDEILDPYVHPYTVEIGNDFILMDDNARPYQTVIVEGLGLERIEWPARSPD